VNEYDVLKDRFPELQWEKNGVLFFEDQAKMRKIANLSLPDSLVSIVDSKQASEIAGVKLSTQAMCFPQAGTINPLQLCRTLMEASSDYLRTAFNTNVSKLERTDDGWQLIGHNNKEICRAENVVIANGYDASRLLSTSIYTVESSRGQLSFLPADEKTKMLKTNVCGEGYVIPAINNLHVVGATYGGNNIALDDDDHDKNRSIAQALLEGGLTRGSESIKGRVSFRTGAQEHLQWAGPGVDEQYVCEKLC